MWRLLISLLILLFSWTLWNDAILKQMKEAYAITSGTLKVRSFFVQKQTKVDCGAFSVANIWIFLKGEDPRSTLFDEKKIRSDLFSSFKSGELNFH